MTGEDTDSAMWQGLAPSLDYVCTLKWRLCRKRREERSWGACAAIITENYLLMNKNINLFNAQNVYREPLN